jgi:signal transduction histidine kinase
MLLRLRWGAFGLRGRIVGAVVVTTAVTLVVAALVLLPQLEQALRHASEQTLVKNIAKAQTNGDLKRLERINYTRVNTSLVLQKSDPKLRAQALTQITELGDAENTLLGRLGAGSVTLIGYIDRQGDGVQINPAGSSNDAAPVTLTAGSGQFPDVVRAFTSRRDQYSFSTHDGEEYVTAAIWLPGDDAVLAVRKSIDEIPLAVAAVRRAFEIAALVAILLTVLIAIPLAGTLVGRLRRLRQAALHIAIDGGGRTNFPVDRARDEVGDLARSFSIMQRRLRQQEEARRAFVATASHELRTPLASLEGMLELLADDLQADQLDLEDAASLLDRARAQSRRLGRLAADLLDLSRLDAEVALRSELLELAELSRAVLAEFELAARARGVKLTLEEGSRPVWALADPGSAARILRILLDNALRIAPHGSEVKVVVLATPVPTLSVIDGGPGVAPEERPLIFERFKRGRETGGEAGFGLGLAIGRELAQRMGGSLVLADTPGAGATFTLTLRPTEAPTPDQIASAAGV